MNSPDLKNIHSEWNNKISTYIPIKGNVCKIYSYFPNDFESASSEESIVIFIADCGLKKNFISLLEFGLYFVFHIYQDKNIIKNCFSDIKITSDSEFIEKYLNCTARVKKPIPFNELFNINRCYQLIDEWNFITFIAETDDGFYGFTWDTTA